ncbi:hypothetical protein EX30DRAFT_340113 [Ascodesmis nigricans]|uniref:Pal1-domain-containing protein n=1 Tax=Ascodesmis nigricans TaxID=341454 RepID=A0A4S2MZI6_9PEZI|nr:hypothetical protein EX30DRAFT_340113 [Ascodesmis nigricans]
MSIHSRSRSSATSIDPSTWSENNPFRDAASASTISRASSVRQPPRSSRPVHHTRRSTSASDVPRRHGRRRNLLPGADTIDRMGDVNPHGIALHHDGPFEATLAARNRIPRYAPVEALKESNEAAIRATPRANIIDSLEKHYPLQGTAVNPPGVGGVGDYEEYDIHRREGNYKRWDHIRYLDEDLKGKGEPSYTIEEFEKQQKAARKAAKAEKLGRRENAYELQEQTVPLSSKEGASVTTRGRSGSSPGEYLDTDMGVRRSASTAGKMEGLGGKIRRKFSLKRRSGNNV